MTSLAAKLTGIMGDAFEAQGLPQERGTVRVSDRPDLCQFQCNGAMAVAKEAKKNPREIAQGLAEALEGNDIFSKIEIAGPGFINLDVTDAYISAHMDQINADERLGVSQSPADKVVLDYGGMNVAKAMHVGHLRPTVIGDCLKHIMGFAGYEALGDIHMGDWGLQMGQIISEFEIRHPEWPYFDENTDNFPEKPLFSYADLEKIYPEASAACKNDENRLELARKATAKLQDGHAGYRALWQHFMDLSIADIKANLAPLGVEFDIWKGEADVDPFIPEIAEDLKARGIAEDNQGAVVIPVQEEGDNKDMPPLMFFKSDGAVTYGTTDLATIYDRIKLYDDLRKIIYIVDKRQSLHFEQVFRAAKRAGYVDDIELRHIGNGTVNGPDGKPFKTRDGGVMRFADMVGAAIDKATERLNEADLAQDMDEAARADVAKKVAMAALKFNELSNQAHVDYVFDLDRMTTFEGKTGPYVLYQGVRILSLLRKAAEQGYEKSAGSFMIDAADRELALLLAEFPAHFDGALNNYTPHVLCDYVFRLAQTFSSFYAACHILSEEDEALRGSRLALCDLTYRHIALILSLLGISIPERM